MRISSFFVAVFLLLGLSAAQAQVTLSLQVPPVGVMQKIQLWNMALLNRQAGSLYVTIGMTLLRTRDNQPVLQAITRPILLNKGLNLVNARNVGPVQYTAGTAGGLTDLDARGFLPVGNYRACYTVYTGEGFTYPIAEDCLPVEVQPLSPPQLNLPADTATLQTPYPQFTWLPPLPVNLFSDLTYDLYVVEVLPGQGTYEAIQQNIPVYNISGYKSLVHQYPASYKSLDTSKVYAWRVIARNEGQFIAQSEVWSFKLATVRPPVTPSVNGHYIPVKKNTDGTSGIYTLPAIGIIGVKYYSFEKDHPATIRFAAADGTTVATITQTILYGDNYLQFPLGKLFEKGKLYSVELTDLQSNIYTARFILNK